jgi:hypothetical protein
MMSSACPCICKLQLLDRMIIVCQYNLLSCVLGTRSLDVQDPVLCEIQRCTRSSAVQETTQYEKGHGRDPVLYEIPQ